MARRRRHEGQREINHHSLAEPDRLLALPLSPSPLLMAADLVASEPLQELEDGRLFHPERGLLAPLAISGVPAPMAPVREQRLPSHRTREFMEYPERVPPKPRSNIRGVPSTMYFDVPQQVVECVRRRVRRQVMFSMSAGRRRKGSLARRRRNEWSDIKC